MIGLPREVVVDKQGFNVTRKDRCDTGEWRAFSTKRHGKQEHKIGRSYFRALSVDEHVEMHDNVVAYLLCHNRWGCLFNTWHPPVGVAQHSQHIFPLSQYSDVGQQAWGRKRCHSIGGQFQAYLAEARLLGFAGNQWAIAVADSITLDFADHLLMPRCTR
jgi:hypothetical protein